MAEKMREEGREKDISRKLADGGLPQLVLSVMMNMTKRKQQQGGKY